MKGVFSTELLDAAKSNDFRFWFFNYKEEVEYAIRKFTCYEERNVFDEAMTQDERTMFLLFLAEVFNEHGL